LNPIENLLSQTIDISEIPALPEAARLAIYKTLTLEKSAEEISNIIKEDPSLTFKILKIANSPLYTRTNSVATVKDAIILLGYKTVKAIILSVTVKDIFEGKEKKWFNYRNFWLHSLATGFVSEEIAKILKLPTEEIAYAVGLLHDIGKIILLLSAEERYREVVETIKKEKLPFSNAETKIFGFDHTDVAEFLFGYWELPQKLTHPIHEHHMRGDTLLANFDRSSLTLKIANEIAHIAGFYISENEPPYNVSEEIVERMGLLDDDLDKILRNLESYISTIGEILNIPKTDIKGYFKILSFANRELGKMYIENQQMVEEVKTKKSVLSELNSLSMLFLKERDIDTALSGSLKNLLHSFDFEAAAIEFFLNEEKSILYKTFYPKLFTEHEKTIKSTDIEESKTVIPRGRVIPFKETQDSRTVTYIIKSNEGTEIGKLFIKTSRPTEPEDIQTFFDQLSLGLNNIRLHLTNKIKSEKLTIAVKQLREENERRQRVLQLIKLILDNSPIGILNIDETGEIETYNRRAEEIFLEDLKGKNFFHLNLFVQNKLENAITQMVLQQKSRDLNVEVDGKQHTFHFEPAPLEGTSSTLILIHDITERIENEMMVIQKEKMATLGELAAGIAHNLRSPLAVVKGIPELILSDLEQKKLITPQKAPDIDKEIKENLQLISKSMEKAFAIIDSIMDFSKQEIGKSEKLDLEQIVNEALILIEHRLKGKQIALRNNTHGAQVFGNKNMLIQIFVNLFTNAIEAIEESGIIEVNYKKYDDKMVISVEDDGRGIKEEDLERVFEPFYTTSGKADGAGIGLSITRKMVTLLGGSIRALSRKKKGTIMEITFLERGSSHGKNFNNRR
jgi:PAS domain S-box-containing protein